MADSGPIQPQFPLSTKLKNGLMICAVQGVTAPERWINNLNERRRPTGVAPNTVKTYECRTSLPVRIFFPNTHSESSLEKLPLVFSIHGGGFCIGAPEDDDQWNRSFADEQKCLVVALNYRKAPKYPFPTPTYDLEALMLAIIADQSLPFDKSRVAIAGFSAGGSLTLSVAQLPSVREKVKPSALLAIYPAVDESVPPEERSKGRYYKTELGPGKRGSPVDFLAGVAPVFDWSYIKAGQNLHDPLLSPFYAARDSLPPNIYFVGAELDQLAHAAWGMACKLAGRPIPVPENKVGQAEPAEPKGALILDNERFAWQHDTPNGSVRWLLVPDQVHTFDHLSAKAFGDLESWQDAQMKTEQYQKLLGEWLHQVVWKNSTPSSD